jgi:hypothetical protein
MIHIEYRYPWTGPRWLRFASAATLALALDLLDDCREDNPGGACRIREEQPVASDPCPGAPEPGAEATVATRLS